MSWVVVQLVWISQLMENFGQRQLPNQATSSAHQINKSPDHCQNCGNAQLAFDGIAMDFQLFYHQTALHFRAAEALVIVSWYPWPLRGPLRSTSLNGRVGWSSGFCNPSLQLFDWFLRSLKFSPSDLNHTGLQCQQAKSAVKAPAPFWPLIIPSDRPVFVFNIKLKDRSDKWTSGGFQFKLWIYNKHSFRFRCSRIPAISPGTSPFLEQSC